MSNIFGAEKDVNNSVNRNTFDLSHGNNLTLGFGNIYPVFSKLLPPNSSIRIIPSMRLSMMPMAFPVRTPIKARMSFFKVPLRTLWKDYPSFVTNQKKGLVPPYINFDSEYKLSKMAATCSLGDYFGLPTTFLGKFGKAQFLEFAPRDKSFILSSDYLFNQTANFEKRRAEAQATLTPDEYTLWLDTNTFNGIFEPGSFSPSYFDAYILKNSDMLMHKDNPEPVYFSSNLAMYNSELFNAKWENYSPVVQPLAEVSNGHLLAYLKDEKSVTFTLKMPLKSKTFPKKTTGYLVFESENKGFVRNAYLPFNLPDAIGQEEIEVSVTLDDMTLDYIGFRNNANELIFDSLRVFAIFKTPKSFLTTAYLKDENASLFTTMEMTTGDSSAVDLTLETSPYYNSTSEHKDKQLKISAYRFRAYEAIYNAYYRDVRNNPFMVDGQPEYNVYLRNNEGGVDNLIYSLRKSNWEKDFLTTALHRPMQGEAPLVGLSFSSQLNGNPIIQLTDENGKRFSVEFEATDQELSAVTYKQLDDNNIASPARSLIDLVESGISIADLRNVNAYTRYLELNERKGYAYKDIVEGRFDVKVKFADMLIPDFIGGFTEDVSIMPVTQSFGNPSSEKYGDVLGSQAAIGFVDGRGRDIECFCDEESLVIGLLTVVPIPSYSQLLPKDMLYREVLDSYSPEFENISYQPILYSEICPVQAFNEDKSLLTKPFGYQRPWYEYLSETDAVHGLFRKELHGFLMNRVFDKKPELSEQFLLVDQRQVNDVFAVTDVSDKILGSIYFDVSAKMPIARIAIPRL